MFAWWWEGTVYRYRYTVIAVMVALCSVAVSLRH